MPDLDDLIARLESAEEGSRELDARLAVAVRYGVGPLNKKALLPRRVELPDLYDRAAAGTYWVSGRGGLSLWTAPEFTTSLDANLPGENIVKSVRSLDSWIAKHWDVVLERPFEATAKTEALARRAAALRGYQARLQKES